MGHAGQDEGADRIPANERSRSGEGAKTDAAAVKIAAARELAEGAREKYRRLQQEFSGVTGAEEPVDEARKALAALDVKSAELGTFSLFVFGAIGIGFWCVIGVVVAALFGNIWSRKFLTDYGVWVVVGFLLLGVLGVVASKLEAWLRRSSPVTARKVVYLVVIPGITVAIMGLIGFGSTDYLSIGAQLILIPVTALLPALTYFLFLATRRPSILNEFIGNLGRLGLLARRTGHTSRGHARRQESDEERRARVEGYFQGFEAIYGTLRFDPGSGPVTRRDLVDRLIASSETPDSSQRLPQTTVLIGDLFHINLLFPLGLLTILTTLGWLLVLQPDIKLSAPTTTADLVPKLTPVNFAFLGAYFFGIQMLFRRFVRRDLSPNAYLAFAVRIILAVIGVWLVMATFDAFPAAGQPIDATPAMASVSAPAVPASSAAAKYGDTQPIAGEPGTPPRTSSESQALQPRIGDTGTEVAPPEPAKAAAISIAERSNAVAARVPPKGEDGFVSKALAFVSERQDELLLLIAFTIGVFPRVLWQYLSAGATKLFRVRLVLPSVEAEQPLDELDGLTVWHEARLEEEDVENVPNMASVDVVELMLHTQIPVERLVGWIDQAILLTAFGKVGASLCDNLRKMGLRTATQVVTAFEAGGKSANALSSAVGEERLAAMVLGLQKEVNFDLVRAWRHV